MKALPIIVFMLSLLPAFAFARVAQCKMYSRDNEASLIMTETSTGVTVQMGDAEPDECVLAPNTSYDMHVQCESDEDAIYFGIKRTTGKIYADFGTISQLKGCTIK